jgi:hypothetical protein
MNLCGEIRTTPELILTKLGIFSSERAQFRQDQLSLFGHKDQRPAVVGQPCASS